MPPLEPAGARRYGDQNLQNELCDVVRSLNLRTFGLRDPGWCPYNETARPDDDSRITRWKDCVQPY